MVAKHFALDSEDRRRVFDEYRAATRVAIEKLEASAAEPAIGRVERSERLVTLGALAELRARLDWLDVAERELSSAG